MKVTLFGATGKTGPYLIREGLKRGFELTVFARTSSSFANSDVRVLRGELTDIGALQVAVRESDAVLSALGPAKMPHPKDLPITKATGAIISAMKQERIKRLIAVSTGTAADPGDGFELKIGLPAFLIKLAVPSVYHDIVELAKIIRASDLDWTMIRAGVLKDHPASEHLNIGLYGHSRHSLVLHREDLARFMFDQISSQEHVMQAPGISSG